MNKNTHLKQHHDTWIYSRRVSKVLKHLYTGKNYITKSLGTSSIKLARIKRDRINGELAIQAQGAYSPDRIQFKQYQEQVKDFAGAIKYPDCGLHIDDVLPRNPIALAAYRQAAFNERSHDYTISLKEALGLLLGHKKDFSKDTLSKLNNSVERFLLFIKETDIPLQDISKKRVIEYIEYLDQEYAHGTITAHLSRLRSIWSHAHQMDEVDTKTSPFCDHYLNRSKGSAPDESPRNIKNKQ